MIQCSRYFRLEILDATKYIALLETQLILGISYWHGDLINLATSEQLQQGHQFRTSEEN